MQPLSGVDSRNPQLSLLPQLQRHAEVFSPALAQRATYQHLLAMLNTPVNMERVSLYARAQNSRRDKDFQGLSERGNSGSGRWASSVMSHVESAVKLTSPRDSR
ncbi:hypothetical protein P7K49_000153 [Saguinus oedipus]|uniref:Uncharacterized protein n=1 Tax=Saguinus oedipus TaxID=9490 RepID=A0ABQ9WAY0_SAGOE|nr:hypothetical protein P7K49_000153 [Saguinus oedipus]